MPMKTKALGSEGGVPHILMFARRARSFRQPFSKALHHAAEDIYQVVPESELSHVLEVEVANTPVNSKGCEGKNIMGLDNQEPLGISNRLENSVSTRFSKRTD